jgi:type II secretory pathway pseudopilin PulG
VPVTPIKSAEIKANVNSINGTSCADFPYNNRQKNEVEPLNMLIRTCQKGMSGSRRLREAFSLVEVMIAFLIFGLVTAGILYGYVQANRIAEWSSMSLGAQSYASQGIEQALAAKWDMEANNEVVADFLPPLSYTVATNWVITSGNTYTQIDTNDVPQSGAPLLLTNYVTVAWIDSLTNGPYLREIKSRVVWRFPLTGKFFTNTIVTLRAPDQ